MGSYSMLPWFFPRHIFSDGQEAFAFASQVKGFFMDMGKENKIYK